MNLTAGCHDAIEVSVEFVHCDATQSDLAQDTREELRRRQMRVDVENAIRLYVELDHAQYRCIEAALVQAGVVAAARGAQALGLWKLTIATKLARVSRACGICAIRFSRCQHVPRVLRVAHLAAALHQAHARADFRDSQLGSTSRRKQLGGKELKLAQAERSAARSFIETHQSERVRLSHTNLYSEGIELIYLACSDSSKTRDYCFGEPFSEDQS